MPRYAICLYSILDQWPTSLIKLWLISEFAGNGGRLNVTVKHLNM